MRLSHQGFVAIFLCVTPTLSLAFFCPSTFNQINAGDSIEQVTALCGPPTKKEEKTIDAPVPQEWVYYIPQKVAVNATHSLQGTLKLSFSFDKNNKAINISSNGIGVGATSLCGPNLQLGDSPDTVKAACGEPSFINKQELTTSEKQQATKETTFTYDGGAKLVFVNGKLKGQD